jgi:hypothetical protein
MNFSVQNNSLSLPVVVSQWLFESTGRLVSIKMYFFNASSARLIRFGPLAFAAHRTWPISTRVNKLKMMISRTRWRSLGGRRAATARQDHAAPGRAGGGNWRE